MAASTAAARTWRELNERQQQWLLVIYRGDQAAERDAKTAWHDGRRSQPASVWRWLQYGVIGSRDSTGPSGYLQEELNRQKVWDQGAGATMEVLQQRGLIETRGEALPLGGTMLFIKLTKSGRAAARAGGADDAAPARRTPKGLLSETLFSMLADAWRAGDDGLLRSHARGGWAALAERTPGLVTIARNQADFKDCITLTEAGAEHYRTHWQHYAQLYPAVTAPNPDAASGPQWPAEVDRYLDQLANVSRTIKGDLAAVSDKLRTIADPPAEIADATPEQSAVIDLARQRHEADQHRQEFLARQRDELYHLYLVATGRYTATACAVVTATVDGQDPRGVLDQSCAELDERGRAPHIPRPVTGLAGVDHEIATYHHAASKGAKKPRRRRDQQLEAISQPAGGDVAAVDDYAAHLHKLAAGGQLQRLLLRRGAG